MSNDNSGLASPVQASLWRLLIDPIEIETHSKEGIELPDRVIELQEYKRYIGKVIDIGPLAFCNNQFKDADGQYHRPCEVGDWIIYGRHTGAEVITESEGDKIRHMRLINDDQVLGLVNDVAQVTIPL